MKHLTIQVTLKLFAALTFVLAAVGQAQMQTPMPGKHQPSAATAATAVDVPLSEGQVLKVNKTSGEVTLKHGPLPSIAMGPMTMSFGVSDPKMLETARVGDTVRFAADIIKGKPTVVRMETLKQ